MEKKQRVAILLPDLRGGGAERVNLDLAHEFQRRGKSVDFILMRARGEFLGEAQEAFRVIELGVDRARQVPRALGCALRVLRPDALLVSMWPLTVLAAVGKVLSGHRCRVVVVEHNTLSVQYRGRGRVHAVGLQASLMLGYRLADARVGVSAGVVRDMARLSRLPEKSFEAIHNPIPGRGPATTEGLALAETLWGIPRGERILTVGSLKPQKNQALLLRAFAQMRERREARLMLVGQGECEADLRQLASDLGIGGRVIFAGFHTDPTPFYETADVFVLSSDYEGFGNVLVEALGVGTPVVSTDCQSGPAEILASGRWGRLTPVGDAQGLASAISDSLVSEYDSERLKERASEFSAPAAAGKYLEMLSEL